MKNLRFPTSKKFWIPVLVLVLTVQAVLLALVGNRVSVLWTENQPTNPMTPEFSYLVQSANRALYSDATVDAEAERVYLPRLRIFIPLNENTERLAYGYISADEDGGEEAILNTDYILNFSINKFSDIPCLQRFVAISINGPIRTWENQSSTHAVTLSDGRMVQIYANSDSSCAVVWGPVSPDEIVASLKEARSY